MEKMNVKPADGKLGVLCVGLGAVTTTFMTGVLMVRKGLAKPVGSMTQYDKIRVGRGADKKYLHYNEIVPMAQLSDIVFGGWDVYPANAYESAINAEVLKEKDINPVKDELQKIVPMKAAFDHEYAKRLDGDNIKICATRWEMVEQLRAKVLNVDVYSGMEEMLYSDEAFAGGLSQARLNGNFGMKLHEHDKYNGSHRARKSFHFFDGTIVCLGTDIENTNTEYPTETTVFQLAAITPENHKYWNGYKSDGQTYIDPNGVGYYLSKSSMRSAKYEKNFPQVTVGERSTKPTSGDWVSLTLQHGKAPRGASYEYAVLPRTDAASLKAFAKKPSYKVLQQDRNAHIVRSLTDNLTSYVLFETPQTLPADGLLQKADTSCLVMIREDRGKLLLTVSQPDLALYRGPSDEAFDKDGKRIERSIYSRPWIDNESGEIPVTVTLKGWWKVAETPYCKLVSADKKQTVLRFTCKDAASFDVELLRK